MGLCEEITVDVADLLQESVQQSENANSEIVGAATNGTEIVLMIRAMA